MKTLLLITLFLISSHIILYSQDIYSSYYNDFTKKNFNIEIILNDNSEYVIFINMLSSDDTNPNGGIYITNYEHSDFIDTLKKASLKYQEWTDIAKENNVRDLTKIMKIYFQTSGFFQIKNEWSLVNVIKLKFKFRIVDGEKYLMILGTNKLKSSEDQFVTHDEFVLVFSSLNELDYFIDLLSVSNVKNFIKKPKKNDLFKD
jgi:hypothetical protein